MSDTFLEIEISKLRYVFGQPNNFQLLWMWISVDDEGTAVCVDRETCKSFSESNSHPIYGNLFKFMTHNDNRVAFVTE